MSEEKAINKVGVIKNPLTVIAVFAGLAEVSATIALPQLEAVVQAKFVWFVMLFPTLLVVLFSGYCGLSTEFYTHRVTSKMRVTL